MAILPVIQPAIVRGIANVIGYNSNEGDVPGPVPPGPQGFKIPAITAGSPVTQAFKTASGNVVVRIAAKNATAVAQNITATYGGAAMTRLDCPGLTSQVNGDYLVAFVIRGAAPGTADIVLTAGAGSSVVNCMVRVGDITVLPADWQGNITGYANSPLSTSYEVDTNLLTASPGNNVIGNMAMWTEVAASPIQLDMDDRTASEFEQWNDYYGDVAARFGYQDDAPADTSLYVYFANGGNRRGGAMMLFELKGATV